MKLIRNEARLDNRFELIESIIKTTGENDFTISPIVSNESNNDMIICLSDLHIGATYSGSFGKYNSDIAKTRLSQYLGEIIKIQKTHNSEKCFVALLGDLVSGNIHSTIAISNRENVIEQVKICAELVSNFVYELSKCFTEVNIAFVNGNHSRLTRKDDAVKDERLDDFIPWYLQAKISHIPNVNLIEDRIDSTLASIEVRGNMFLLCHGDYDNFSKSGIADLVLMLGFKPCGVLFGHYHTCAVSDIANIKLIRSGSLGGSGDDYTIQKRIIGNPSQMVCIVENSGVKTYYPVELN